MDLLLLLVVLVVMVMMCHSAQDGSMHFMTHVFYDT
jgi:hypothetical protein